MRGGTNLSVGLDKADAFQSTHPMRGGTGFFLRQAPVKIISIHPPHAGWDPNAIRIRRWRENFNPPTPCGVGRRQPGARAPSFQFQSTHPMRGGTRGQAAGVARGRFQSTHPMRGGTAKVHKTGRETSAQLTKYRDIPPAISPFLRFPRQSLLHFITFFCANQPGRACSLPLRTP